MELETGSISDFIVALQGPFRDLHFELIGDDSAPTYFRVTEDTGEISVSRDLRETDLEIFNVSVSESH